MKILQPVAAIINQQWKTTVKDIASIAMIFETVPQSVVLAWMAMQSPTPAVLTYLLVGAPLMSMCSGLIFKVGWSLSDELWGYTLDFSLISRTPLMVILVGKSIAQMIYRLPMGVMTLLAMFIVTRQLPSVADVPLLLVALFFACISLVAVSLLFSPLMVLVGGKAGFFNAIIPLAVVLSGFLFPIDRLPFALEIIARFMPTSWAMVSIWQSIDGVNSSWSFVSNILLCVLTSLFMLFVTYFLCRVVERKLRVTGELVTY